MASQPPVDPMREQYFHKVLELVNRNEMAANKIFSILSSSPDSLELFTSQTRLIERVEELVVALRLDVGVSKSKGTNHKGARLNTGMAVGDITAPGAMPTTPLVAGKQAASSASSRFNVLFKQVESVAFTMCEDKGLSASIATQLCNGKDLPSLERMVAGKKMLESSIERKYKESISDSFLKRITEYTDVSKAPGLLKVILGLPNL